ncbi:ParB/RepB/Spo0J family partition protein [Phenylobacterium sp.]|uniref:ParB/RepB/Spo0J family partition protein n=1 Tax=Phenylobacterium sp. TaxID=1871053 RepID=UPI00391BEAD9
MGLGASRTIVQLPVARIWVPPGRRPIDEAHAHNLAVSYAEIGQRQAIEVRVLCDNHAQRPAYGWELTIGGHRLRAAEIRGWRAIDAVVVDENDLDAAIAEADENLIRRDLNALERAQALASRLSAWAARYPDRALTDEDGARPKRGRPKKMPQDAAISAPSTMGFAEEAAAASNLSRDTVERALAIYRGIPAGLQAKLAESPLADNEALLRQLANLPDKEEQAAAAEVLLAGRTKNISDALAIAAGREPVKPAQTPVDQAVKDFRKLWGGLSPSAKAAILHDLAGRPLPKGWIVREDR